MTCAHCCWSQARVVFAAAAHASPHILFLDEPTNHLDMTTIAYLSQAISAFEGVVVLVSHNRDLITALGPVRVCRLRFNWMLSDALRWRRRRSCGR